MALGLRGTVKEFDFLTSLARSECRTCICHVGMDIYGSKRTLLYHKLVDTKETRCRYSDGKIHGCTFCSLS
jgi:hypothetical protein